MLFQHLFEIAIIAVVNTFFYSLQPIVDGNSGALAKPANPFSRLEAGQCSRAGQERLFSIVAYRRLDVDTVAIPGAPRGPALLLTSLFGLGSSGGPRKLVASNQPS